MQADAFKLLFTGPMGAGKTTAINAISDIPCVSTDVDNSDQDECAKELTTAALDYGHIALDENSSVHLYGTPGQQRFSFMWPILAQSAAGVVLLLNGSHPDLLTHLDTYVDAFWMEGKLPLVIGVGRLDDSNTISQLEKISSHLESRQCNPPVLATDVRDKQDVLAIVDTLLCLIEAYNLDAQDVASV